MALQTDCTSILSLTRDFHSKDTATVAFSHTTDLYLVEHAKFEISHSFFHRETEMGEWGNIFNYDIFI